MIEYLTKETRQVIHLAQQSSFDSGYTFIGTEHILLGLFQEGTVTEQLKAAGLTEELIKEHIFKHDGQEITDPSKLVENVYEFTPLSRRMLLYATKVTKGELVAPQDILECLVRIGEGVGHRILEDAAPSLLNLSGII